MNKNIYWTNRSLTRGNLKYKKNLKNEKRERKINLIIEKKTEELTERIDFTPSVPYFIGFIIDFQVGTEFAVS